MFKCRSHFLNLYIFPKQTLYWLVYITKVYNWGVWVGWGPYFTTMVKRYSLTFPYIDTMHPYFFLDITQGYSIEYK